MILGNLKLPSTRAPHATIGAALSVACLALAAIGCESTRGSTPTTTQQFRPTTVIDPKERIDQNTVSTTTTTTTSTSFPQVKL
jgi:hypothetical protein